MPKQLGPPATPATGHASFGYSFPAIRGIQAKREYYVSMCPMRLIPKMFTFNGEELPADLRAQRRLNRARLPEITSYIVRNKEDYVLSAITASINGRVSFVPLTQEGDGGKIGTLNVDMGARFIINDGQHRRAAIERALEDRPELGDETISVVFFVDPDLTRCQQMFADLNRYAIRTSPSLGILYDHRDTLAKLAKGLMNDSEIFRGLIEPEKTTLSSRSRRLFTLSAVYGATNELLAGMDEKDPDELVGLARDYWETMAKAIKEWWQVHKGKVTAGEIRQDYIHTHAVVLQAMGRAGNILVLEHPRDWQKRLEVLGKMDWQRSNPKWEGRAMIGGRISKGQHNVVLVTAAIKARLKLPLSAEERKTEGAHRRGEI